MLLDLIPPRRTATRRRISGEAKRAAGAAVNGAHLFHAKRTAAQEGQCTMLVV